MNKSNERLRYVGEQRYLTVDFSDDLEAGQTISSATVTSSNTGLATVVNGSTAVSSDGKKVSVVLNHVAVGDVVITVQAAVVNPAETILAAVNVRQVVAT